MKPTKKPIGVLFPMGLTVAGMGLGRNPLQPSANDTVGGCAGNTLDDDAI